MRSIYYRPGKMAFRALFSGGACIVVSLAWMRGGSILMGLGALASALATIVSLRAAFATRPAIQFDERGITFDKFGKSLRFEWRQIHSINFEEMTLRYMGLIPVARHQFLVVKADGGMFGAARHAISAKAIELPPGGLIELCAILRAAQLAAVGEAGAAMKGAGPSGWGTAPPRGSVAAEPEGSAFDPDAAIARYLAAKAADGGRPAETPSVPAQTPSAPTMPGLPRRTFGRRVG
jgi:hypothetical protein